jgi:hypothetical protein
LLYLAVAVLGAFAQVIRVQPYVAGDATLRWLGIMLMLGTVSYEIHALAQFFALSFAPGLSSMLVIPETLSEASLLLHLLIKGVKTRRVAT